MQDYRAIDSLSIDKNVRIVIEGISCYSFNCLLQSSFIVRIGNNRLLQAGWANERQSGKKVETCFGIKTYRERRQLVTRKAQCLFDFDAPILTSADSAVWAFRKLENPFPSPLRRSDITISSALWRLLYCCFRSFEISLWERLVDCLKDLSFAKNGRESEKKGNVRIQCYNDIFSKCCWQRPARRRVVCHAAPRTHHPLAKQKGLHYRLAKIVVGMLVEESSWCTSVTTARGVTKVAASCEAHTKRKYSISSRLIRSCFHFFRSRQRPNSKKMLKIPLKACYTEFFRTWRYHPFLRIQPNFLCPSTSSKFVKKRNLVSVSIIHIRMKKKKQKWKTNFTENIVETIVLFHTFGYTTVHPVNISTQQNSHLFRRALPSCFYRIHQSPSPFQRELLR